jgi:hypothetical protein
MATHQSAPAAVIAAFEHVRAVHPEVVSVTFDREDEECGGFWVYEDENGRAPSFDARVDVSLLEDALDAAWEAWMLPATFKPTA